MNPRLLLLAAGVAIGYVLGTRDGRERYDAMKAKINQLWGDPRVVRARKDVETYARQQAPIIRERAEAAAKAAPGVVADVAKDVADRATAVADRATATARDVAGRASASAKDVAGRVTEAASDVREQAGKVAADLRERGEAAIDSVVTTAGVARDGALAAFDDDDDEDAPKKS